jgi:hypothetical protein
MFEQQVLPNLHLKNSPLRLLMSACHQCLFLRSSHEKIKRRPTRGKSESPAAATSDATTKLNLRVEELKRLSLTGSSNSMFAINFHSGGARAHSSEDLSSKFFSSIFSFSGEHCAVYNS